MKRGGPLKRSDKPMAQGGLPNANKAQKALFEKLTDPHTLGCAVCLFRLRIEGSRGEIHHLLSGGNRISHWLTIPLCASHHRGLNAEACAAVEPGFTYRHSDRGADGGLAAFEAAYGSEYDLLERCEQWINENYSHNYQPDGLLTDEQAPQGDSDNSDTATDSERTGGDSEVGMDEISPMETFSGRVRIHVMHHRYRLADFDNLNAKGAIDGLVQAGLLQNDSPKFVQGPILHDQVKVSSYDEEKTVITLEEVIG